MTKKQENRRLLIIEDDPGLQSQLKWCFDDEEIFICDNEKEALALLRRIEPQVITLDLGLPPDPGGSSVGFSILEQIQTLAPKTKVIVITGREEKENAVKAIGGGAYDFYQKPIDADILKFVVNRAFRLFELEEKNRLLEKASIQSPITGLITSSPEMLKLCRTVERVADTDATALILGDTGTGKELIARALHGFSERKGQNFSPINCAAIPDNLLESELFGYEKGAFTGANTKKKGKIEYADGGTLFLDEIGDMPSSLQAKMLRFLQERTIQPLGSNRDIPVNVRIVCATHRNLEKMIEEGSFREDLYYRLSEIVLKLPALIERDGDALVLARSFLNRFAKEQDRSIAGFNDGAIQAIESHNWPGNIRELENKVKRACIMAEGNKITAQDLDIQTKEGHDNSLALNLKTVRNEAERKAIVRALAQTEYNMAKASKLLGVTRPTLYTLVKKFHVQAPKE
ncbi:MAG: PEP-CTERM-box response regulator transcription factor [Gammaproteobacteria bacterium]|nr:PEP-CTERM-box response regulator transcription factor [Gammaproteobacteria bacterium]